METDWMMWWHLIHLCSTAACSFENHKMWPSCDPVGKGKGPPGALGFILWISLESRWDISVWSYKLVLHTKAEKVWIRFLNNFLFDAAFFSPFFLHSFFVLLFAAPRCRRWISEDSSCRVIVCKETKKKRLCKLCKFLWLTHWSDSY